VRIAIVGTELCAVDARGGGLEQVLRRWASFLATRHAVTLVSFTPGGRALERSSDQYETRAISRVADLRAAVRRCDVVSLHNRPQWAARCGGVPAAVTFHNYPPAWRTTVRAVDARLSAVSRALAAASTARLGGAPVAVVPPSIDPVLLAPARRPREPVVLAPNRLMVKKGVLDLLAVAARLPDLRFEFTNVISPWLHPTAEHRKLRQAVEASANARLVAPMTPAEMVGRYGAAGVVACPVREPEGLGLVALEAQACGAPLVTTDLGGIREATFPPNECVPARDLEALEAALVAAIGRRGGAARRAVVARYSPAASGAAFEAWLTVTAEDRR
jgi:glycosyltransferase involved in cell wall biosynthesis